MEGNRGREDEKKSEKVREKKERVREKKERVRQMRERGSRAYSCYYTTSEGNNVPDVLCNQDVEKSERWSQAREYGRN